jgi:hypothetical protein
VAHGGIHGRSVIGNIVWPEEHIDAFVPCNFRDLISIRRNNRSVDRL